MQNRLLRTKLPISEKLLTSKLNNYAQEQLLSKSANNKKFYDRTSRKRKDFYVGQPVRMQKGKIWVEALIVEKCVSPRSYIVRTTEGNTYRRNSIHLRASREQIDSTPALSGQPQTLFSRTRSGLQYK